VEQRGCSTCWTSWRRCIRGLGTMPSPGSSFGPTRDQRPRPSSRARAGSSVRESAVPCQSHVSTPSNRQNAGNRHVKSGTGSVGSKRRRTTKVVVNAGKGFGSQARARRRGEAGSLPTPHGNDSLLSASATRFTRPSRSQSPTTANSGRDP
jgi:hypothetical protein